jgi:hypothetical protein
MSSKGRLYTVSQPRHLSNRPFTLALDSRTAERFTVLLERICTTDRTWEPEEENVTRFHVQPLKSPNSQHFWSCIPSPLPVHHSRLIGGAKSGVTVGSLLVDISCATRSKHCSILSAAAVEHYCRRGQQFSRDQRLETNIFLVSSLTIFIPFTLSL